MSYIRKQKIILQLLIPTIRALVDTSNEQWLLCEIRLESLGTQQFELAFQLMTGMQTRLKMIFNNNPAFLAALYLDPHYNFDSEFDEGILTATEKEKAIVSVQTYDKI